MNQYQVAILGAGPGGYVAAIKAAQLGLRVALIESSDIGGTCLNRGCIPTKTLLHTAELIDELQQAESLGLILGELGIDFATLRSRKTHVVEQIRDGVEQLLAANKVSLYRAKARIAANKEILLEGNEGQQSISADKVIIATGSTPAIPPIEGISLPHVYTSDTFIDEVPTLERLVIIGGGVIGMEFASIYRSFGTKVTVLEAADRIIPTLDKEIAQSLNMVMKKRGTKIIPKALVKRIMTGDTISDTEAERPDNGKSGQEATLRVEYEYKGEQVLIDTDAVLVAVGRKPALSDLLDEGLEIVTEAGRIVVDDYLRSSIDGIYAIGDINSREPQLAHAASAEGLVAVSDIAGVPCTVTLDTIPSCIYTSPEIASVGMTEREAKDSGIVYKVGKYSLAGNARSVISNQDRSFAKVIANEEGVIIGAQLMSARATDIIGELSLGITAGLTAEQMLEAVRPHPSFAEAIGEALEALSGSSIHTMPKR